MKNDELYTRLGITPDARLPDIKKAYKLLAQKYHPDKPGGSAEKFSRILEAYEILSNPERKNFYDSNGITAKEPTIEIKALSKLGELFTALLQHKNRNLKTLANKLIEEESVKLKNALAEHEHNIGELKTLSERIKCSAEDNFFASTVDQQIQSIQAKIKVVQEGEKILSRVAEMLGDYDDEFQEMNEYHGFHTLSSTGSATT